MKKRVLPIIGCCLLLTLTGCGDKQKVNQKEDKTQEISKAKKVENKALTNFDQIKGTNWVASTGFSSKKPLDVKKIKWRKTKYHLALTIGENNELGTAILNKKNYAVITNNYRLNSTNNTDLVKENMIVSQPLARKRKMDIDNLQVVENSQIPFAHPTVKYYLDPVSEAKPIDVKFYLIDQNTLVRETKSKGKYVYIRFIKEQAK